jgi:hypothetical protein
MSDIPILEGEEMWAQEAIDRPKAKYKVVYYIGGGNYAGYKWFNSFNEASEFAAKIKTGDVIEIKRYDESEQYHYGS